MPANLSPEYKAAEAAFRATRDPRMRLDGLREMHLLAAVETTAQILTRSAGGAESP